MLSFIVFVDMARKSVQDLNTSHVIFYRVLLIPELGISKFKYISCYLLSEGNVAHTLHVKLFKYISCYLLSKRPIRVLDF